MSPLGWRRGTTPAHFPASLLATVCPPLLIAYCVLWATQFIPGDHVIKTTCSVIAGLSFTLIGGFFLEVLLVLGVFASKYARMSPWSIR